MSALRLGTRGSALALAQARWVADRLPFAVELVTITTAGDLARGVGDKSRWVDSIEAALVAGEIDFAVHSAKDVPGELAEGLAIVATPPRASAADVVVGELARGARVGTSSLRRRAQLLALRPDLEVVELRGNVDTRLRKLADGEADAIVLAAAGLERLGRADVVTTPLPGRTSVPAPGQGTLAIEARAGDDRFAAVDDPVAARELAAERDAVRMLGADCHTPVGVHAQTRADGCLWLRGFVGLPNGSAWLYDEVTGGTGEDLAGRMLAAGAGPLLAQARAGGAAEAGGGVA